jgi:hypothetical protein
MSEIGVPELADRGSNRRIDPKRPSVNWRALSMLRAFPVDGIEWMQHLFLCLKEQELRIQVSINPREE